MQHELCVKSFSEGAMQTHIPSCLTCAIIYMTGVHKVPKQPPVPTIDDKEKDKEGILRQDAHVL